MTTVPAKRTATGAPVVALVCVGIFVTTLDTARAALEPVFVRAFHAALTTCAAFAGLGALAALVRGREPQTQVEQTPVPVISRRLKLLALATCTLFGAARVAGAQSVAPVRAAVDSNMPDSLPALQQPTVVASRAGVLRVAFTAAPATVMVAGRPVTLMAYDGAYIPPTLRARPGDTIQLRLINALAQPTNVHWHGLTVSPKANSDNPFLHIMPGQTADYEIRIPANHRPGLYWYHPHPHGLSDTQIRNGMSGALIVEGLLDPFPTLRDVRELVLLLKDVQVENGRVERLEIGKNTVRTINGVANPSIVLRPGETQLWRIANVGADLYYKLALDGHRFNVVARDGQRLARLEPTDTLVLTPGGRVEALVTGGAPGVYSLRDADIDTGHAGNQYAGTIMATVRVQGSPATPAAVPASLLPVEDLRGKVTHRRTIMFTESADGDAFFIDGKAFDMNRTDTRVKLGAVEEWTIRNNADELHSFHIHQTPFQVSEINGVPQPADGYRDVVDVPIGGEVKVVIPFTNPLIIGRFVYHCHILAHEDKGMMATIEVVPP